VSGSTALAELQWVMMPPFRSKPRDRVRCVLHAVNATHAPAYSHNECAMLLSAMIDSDVNRRRGSDRGLWGEGRGSSRPVVERHSQAEVRALVSLARNLKQHTRSRAAGWRTKVAIT
jgi:hypothetical protein